MSKNPKKQLPIFLSVFLIYLYYSYFVFVYIFTVKVYISMCILFIYYFTKHKNGKMVISKLL